MNLREALIQQSPSLELQRAAQAEIARLDALLNQKEGEIRDLKALLGVQERPGASGEEQGN